MLNCLLGTVSPHWEGDCQAGGFFFFLWRLSTAWSICVMKLRRKQRLPNGWSVWVIFIKWRIRARKWMKLVTVSMVVGWAVFSESLTALFVCLYLKSPNRQPFREVENGNSVILFFLFFFLGWRILNLIIGTSDGTFVLGTFLSFVPWLVFDWLPWPPRKKKGVPRPLPIDSNIGHSDK